MFETLQAVDIFFVVLTVSVAVATAIGVLIGWHVFGVARDVHHVSSAVREEGEKVVREAGTLTRTVMEQKATGMIDSMARGVEKPRRVGRKKVTG